MHWVLLCVLLIRKQLNPIMVTRPFVRSVLHYLLHPYLQFIQKQFTEIHQNTQQCTKGQTKIHQDTNVLHSAIQNVQWLCNSEWWMLRTHISLQKAKSFNKKLVLTSRSMKNGHTNCVTVENGKKKSILWVANRRQSLDWMLSKGDHTAISSDTITLTFTCFLREIVLFELNKATY